VSYRREETWKCDVCGRTETRSGDGSVSLEPSTIREKTFRSGGTTVFCGHACDLCISRIQTAMEAAASAVLASAKALRESKFDDEMTRVTMSYREAL
jgi:hypothetical protein